VVIEIIFVHGRFLYRILGGRLGGMGDSLVVDVILSSNLSIVNFFSRFI